MTKCPKCGNLSVTYDSYFGIVRCLTNFCDYIDTASKEPLEKQGVFGASGSYVYIDRCLPK